MKNPQITLKLRDLMNRERQAKTDLIGCIIDNYRETAPHLVNGDTFDMLYNMEMYQLNDILSDLISELYANIEQQLERFKQRN
jgi:hypothetical protein